MVRNKNLPDTNGVTDLHHFPAIVDGLVSGTLVEAAGYGVAIWVTAALSLVLPIVIAATGLWRIEEKSYAEINL